MLHHADATKKTTAAALRAGANVALARRGVRCRWRRRLHTDESLVIRPKGLESPRSGSAGRGSRESDSTSALVFTAPPDQLEEGRFERPTPLLLVAGEGQPAAWWSEAASFFASRGCTVGTMALTGRGSSPTDTLTLRALQSGVAAAVEKSGLTPPVVVAHSMAGFICQQYLQSYSASGLVLIDSFPPCPRALANHHLSLVQARVGDPEDLASPPPGMNSRDLALLMADDPTPWEGLLRRHFADVHRHSPFQAPLNLTNADRRHTEAPADPDPRHQMLVDSSSAWDNRFPVKAFAQMCLDHPSSTLRLESRVVETLVLGSMSRACSELDPPSSSATGGPSSGKVVGGVDNLAALDSAKTDGLEAICEFHGTDGWILVDSRGFVRGVGDDAGEAGGATPWKEVLWEWYDARF